MSGFIIEEERGTSRREASPQHKHNGYSGGDFSAPADPAALARWFSWGVGESTRLATSPSV